MHQRELSFHAGLLSLPSPKRKHRQGDVFGAWTPFLAAFSEQFAIKALEMLCPQSDGVIYDPFSGSGTTLQAAAHLNLDAIANDLDPVSALISRAKIASRADLSRVVTYLEPKSSVEQIEFALEIDDYFLPTDIQYAAQVFSKVRNALPRSKKYSPLELILSDRGRRFDSEAVALAAMVMASRSTAKILRGSNPVWCRKALKQEIVMTEPLSEASQRLANRMVSDLGKRYVKPLHNRLLVTCADVLSGDAESPRFDIVLTSPPYLNRLDYVVSHLSEALLLSGFHKIDIDALRRSMIGTTKMVSKSEPSNDLGETCNKLLKRIRNHTSHASKGYYYHFYVQYFVQMESFFSRLSNSANSGAQGFMVVQNSYYKEVLIESTRIFSELAEKHGCHVEILRSEEVSAHYGNLSPQQMTYVPNKRLHEWLLYLRFR